MKIYVVTPIYAITTEGDGATPLVHYFAREWVKMGHEVTVFNFQAKFPRPYYWVGKLFQHQLNTKLGMLVPTHYPKDDDFIYEGVKILKRTITKYKPHSDFNKKNTLYAIDVIRKEIENYGIPDYFIGHWGSPCLDILPRIKELYHRPISIVFHTNSFNLEKRYGVNVIDTLKDFDVIGFRNKVAQSDFINKYFKPSHSFICYSGVSEAFLNAGFDNIKTYKSPVFKFVYVGSMIARKYASRLYFAVCDSYPHGHFSIKYIGNGAEVDVIKAAYEHRKKGNIEFTGRIPREDIIKHLLESDVFCMISEGEIFGLVYLEAMALGLITIGSKNEGIDGIIVDGVNGFLCEAGNTNELVGIINKIKSMSFDELNTISAKAKETALAYSDYNVAKRYIDSISLV